MAGGSFPQEVQDVIRTEPAPPHDDPTMGVAVAQAPSDPRASPNRLVTIGDSLTHGFQSGAIFNTSLSWPMIIAWEMGWDRTMRVPAYPGFGGLPLNVEYFLRDVEHRFGDSLAWWQLPLAAFEVEHKLAELEDWWERGPGSHVPATTGIMHNLSVYGWDLRDALDRRIDNIRASIAKPKKDHLFSLVENAQMRAAERVYASAVAADGAPLSAFGAAKALGEQGAGGEPGIETLVVALGANNILPAVVQLNVVWSGPGYDQLGTKGAYTAWLPSHFRAELDRVVGAVSEVRARHVIFATVPHVTIAPLARGVGTQVRRDSRYFPYYTRPWIGDASFDAKEDPYITGDDARALDSVIDAYNVAIAGEVADARRAGKDWYVFDMCTLLDRLATRRYIANPQARPDWWTPYELPPELAALTPVPDTLFLSAGPEGRTAGGLFSLDGVHPTTVAYGLVAQEVIHIMQRAGVQFLSGDGVTPRTGPVRVDMNRLLRRDSLVVSPPASLGADIGWLAWFQEKFDFLERILGS
jgi:hypothetical protein